MKINPLTKEFEAHLGALTNIIIKVVEGASHEEAERFIKKIEPILKRYNDTLDNLGKLADKRDAEKIK